MPDRHENSSQYRFGFGGQEKDDEISGNGNSYTAEFWQYDPRLGRRWNVDPINLAWQSSYTTYNNNPIVFNDPKGLFATRKEARKFAKENGGGFRLRKFGKNEFVLKRESDGSQFSYNSGTAGYTFKGTLAEQKETKARIEEWILIDDLTRQGLWDPNITPEEGRTNFINNMALLIAPNLLAQTVAPAKVIPSESPLLLGTTRDRLLSAVQNPQLKKIVEYLWRADAKFGNGSTGAMIRIEKAEGIVTSGSGSHLQKAGDALDNLRKLMKENYGKLSESDRKIIFEIIEDLTTGTGLKW